MIDHKFIAAAQRVPAHVIGDGTHSIAQLAELANQDPRRGYGHEKVLTKIKLDGATERLLALRHMTVDSVPEHGQMVALKTTANLSTGGTSIDVTAACSLEHRAGGAVSELIGLDPPASRAADSRRIAKRRRNLEVNAARSAIYRARPRGVAAGRGSVIEMLFRPDAVENPDITTPARTQATTPALAQSPQCRQDVGLTPATDLLRKQLGRRRTRLGRTGVVVLRDPDRPCVSRRTRGILREGSHRRSDAASSPKSPRPPRHADVHTLEELAR